jgi:hypothetical protein
MEGGWNLDRGWFFTKISQKFQKSLRRKQKNNKMYVKNIKTLQLYEKCKKL